MRHEGIHQRIKSYKKSYVHFRIKKKKILTFRHEKKYNFGVICSFNLKVLPTSVKTYISRNPLITFHPLWVWQAWIKKKKNAEAQTVWPLGGSYLAGAHARPFDHPRCLLCCSAIVLGAGQLGLEPVLGGEEAVASQHRDQPHDLWPFPHAHKAEHGWTQGKDTQMQTCSFILSVWWMLGLCWPSLFCWMHLKMLHCTAPGTVLVDVSALLLFDKVYTWSMLQTAICVSRQCVLLW